MANETTIFNQDKLLEMYEALPQQLKDAIFDVDVADKITKIGQKFGLNVEQTGLLAEATGLVMLGALHPRSYIQKLEETLKIERTKAVDVAKEVNHEIFFPIREQLKKLHGMEDTEEMTGERTTERGDLLKKLAELKRQISPSAPLAPTPAPILKQPQPTAPVIPSTQKIPSPPARGAESGSPEPSPRASYGAGMKQEASMKERLPENLPVQQTQKLAAPLPTREQPSMTHVSQALKDRFAPQNAEARSMNQESKKEEVSKIEKVPGNIPIQKQEEKPATAAPKLEALQNEIQGLLQKAPEPKTQAAPPRPIPGWAKQSEQRTAYSVQRSEDAGAGAESGSPEPSPRASYGAGMKQEASMKERLPENLPVQQTKRPVQKIPMQEIRPRPTEATRDKQQETRPGPGGDRYKEPID